LCRILRTSDSGRAEAIVWPTAEQARGRRTAPGVVRLADGPAETQDRSIDAERRIQEARQAGYAEGEAAGRRQVAPLIEQLARTLDALAALRPRLRKEAESDLVRLAMAIARRILRRELGVDPEAIQGLVQVALERLQGQEGCRVRVHPSFEPVLRAALSRLAAGSAIEVVPDAGREPGDVIFETSRGDLDASVETQLEEIERGLTDRLRSRS
jgi:flagellar assembly protein FliH